MSFDKLSSGFLARLRERLGNTVTIANGIDLAEAPGEFWDADRKDEAVHEDEQRKLQGCGLTDLYHDAT